MALFVVSTPIGNLSDLSPRAREALSGADVIACEDTRHTGRLLSHIGVKKPMVRFDQHVHRRETPRLVDRLRRGESVALVTDAGTPGVSDPGAPLIAAAVEAKVPVVPVPGPSAALAALAGSGLPMDRFTFLGFLPRRAGRIRRELEGAGADRTIVFFESVFRLADTLGIAKGVFGDVPAVVGRELTKMHEEFVRGRISEVLEQLTARKELKGEATVVLAPQANEAIKDQDEE